MWPLLLLLWTAASMAIDHYPLGVNLGMKFITTAYFTSSNESVPVTKLEGSQAYKNHMARLVEDSQIRMVLHRQIYIQSGEDYIPAPPEYQTYSDSDRKLLTSILAEIAAASKKTLGHPVDIAAASIPTGLDRVAREHLTTTLIHADPLPEVSNEWQVLEYLNVARLAYHLDTAQAFGHEEFNLLDGPLNLVAYIDFNDYSLDMWTADATEFNADALDGSHAQAREMEMGCGKVDWGDAKDRISHQIGQFIEQLLGSEDGEYVRAIIVSGEAEGNTMDDVRSAVKNALPDSKKSLVCDQIDPVFVAAVGAAQRARKFVVMPEMWEDEHNHDDPTVPYSHDEL